jgi:hypothetical protein
MAGILKVYDIGALGVNVDADPISLDDQELRLAQNAIRDPLGSDSGLRKRPGLLAFNTTSITGSVLGGIGVPFPDLSPAGGTFYLYIGRGPLT